MIWHSDKPGYQKLCCEKIALLLGEINTPEKKMEWFDHFLYIFNMHWDKVDNFRIDKYLMFLRFHFKEALKFLKSTNYEESTV